jgi:hypothetical protein
MNEFVNETEENFVESNKIIAEYDGWVPKSTNEEKQEDKFVKKHPNKQGFTIIKAEKLAYHTSWNWLMPVFIRVMEKISKEGGYILLKNDVVEINKEIFNAGTFKLSVYKAILKQIKNENQNL